jgi:hypothetical protein
MPLKINKKQLEIDCHQSSEGQVARDIKRMPEIPSERWAHEQNMDQARTAK